MAVHRFYHPLLGPGPQTVRIEGEEARHAARVKRLRIGEPVEIISGDGARASATALAIHKVAGAWVVDLGADAPVREPEPAPLVEVCSPAPKGPRLEQMIDQLSQVGATAWRPLITDRSGPAPRTGKLERLGRVTIESAKQCGRSHLLDIGSPVTLAEAVAGREGWLVAVLDGAGAGLPATSYNLRILVGPEGGWTDDERRQAREAGAALWRLGPLTMRIEVAAVVGAAGVRLAP